MEKPDYKLQKTNIFPLGASYTDKGIRISTVTRDTEGCGIIFFPDDGIQPVKIEFPKWCRQGRISAVEIIGLNNCCKYLLYDKDSTYLDPCMKSAEGFGEFGQETSPFSKIDRNPFVHKAERPYIPYWDCIFYMLHVRGFTKHPSSKVRDGGTFKGLEAKLNYIKTLGATSIILMPVYEFNEIIKAQSLKTESKIDDAILHSKDKPGADVPEHIRNLGKFNGTPANTKPLVNFWGYTDGFYYCPKSSYAAEDDAATEFHDLVEKGHELGLEIILQFNFPYSYGSVQIIDILRFWAERYNVDGFQLIGSGLPMDEILSDPYLYGLKILYDQGLCNRNADTNPEHGQVSIDFMNDMRCFLKGDPNHADSVARKLRDADPGRHPVNTLAKQDSMRLIDLVSYNEKHNLENGENGRDGSDSNYSWNCGFEGATKKKNILSLRLKQVKNALALMLLSQGTPLIYSGDEFGNSQYGNNNPYNQDNAIGYIKWNKSSTGKEIYDFTKKLIEIRKNNPCLRSDHILSGRDQLSLGYPDISLHGVSLWRPDLGPTSHTFGVLYYNKYFDLKDNRLLYIIFNLHWEQQDIALPILKDGQEWKMCLSSDTGNKMSDEKFIAIEPRSIVVLEVNLG